MALFWGASWSFAKTMVQHMPPIAGAGLRFVFSTAILLMWLYYRQGFAPLRALGRPQWAGLIIAGFFGIYLYAVFFMVALQYVPAGKGATTVALNPVLPLLLGAWLFREPLNLRIFCGMALAVAGALTAISRGDWLALFSGGLGMGEYMLFGAVLSWGAYTLIGRFLLKGIPPLISTLVAAGSGSLMLLVTSFLVEGVHGWQQLAHTQPAAWMSLAGIVVLATVLGYLWYFDGIKALGAGKAAIYMALVPVFGITVSTLWLNEPLHVSLLGGAVMVVGGMLVMNLRKT
ncbi:DMT family transporter [Neisseria dentiae]|nr:DMT family transporter [Neisseria dentiae]